MTPSLPDVTGPTPPPRSPEISAAAAALSTHAHNISISPNPILLNGPPGKTRSFAQATPKRSTSRVSPPSSAAPSAEPRPAPRNSGYAIQTLPMDGPTRRSAAPSNCSKRVSSTARRSMSSLPRDFRADPRPASVRRSALRATQEDGGGRGCRKKTHFSARPTSAAAASRHSEPASADPATRSNGAPSVSALTAPTSTRTDFAAGLTGARPTSLISGNTMGPCRTQSWRKSWAEASSRSLPARMS